MNYTKDFSVIVPCWRGAVKFLPKLFESIPENERIEIIVVDNSKDPLRREEIDSNRNISFLHSEPERHAGGSRNDGMAIAKGKWLLFADADDYYSPDAFDIYYQYFNTDAEIVYTGMGGIYEDTGEPSERGERYAQMVHRYCEGEISDLVIRTSFSSPCCKMVSHELVNRHGLAFDEVVASNDTYFSLLTGFYANKITAVDKTTYIATVSRGTLTKRRDFEVLESRMIVRLRCNQFLKKHELSNYQASVMIYCSQAIKIGVVPLFRLLWLIVKYHQNPFIGCTRWLGSYKKGKERNKKDEKYFIH